VFHDHLAKQRESEELDATREVVDSRPGAHELAVEGEQIGLLRRAFLELPLDRREVLVLARFESRPYSEIAELLDTTVGAVKVRVHRATNELREIVCSMLEPNTASARPGELT
jgi:RNA polymerase sigma-70 factor, ECF subfamily